MVLVLLPSAKKFAKPSVAARRLSHFLGSANLPGRIVGLVCFEYGNETRSDGRLWRPIAALK
jgi:hypothetical protein